MFVRPRGKKRKLHQAPHIFRPAPVADDYDLSFINSNNTPDHRRYIYIYIDVTGGMFGGSNSPASPASADNNGGNWSVRRRVSFSRCVAGGNVVRTRRAFGWRGSRARDGPCAWWRRRARGNTEKSTKEISAAFRSEERISACLAPARRVHARVRASSASPCYAATVFPSRQRAGSAGFSPAAPASRRVCPSGVSQKTKYRSLHFAVVRSANRTRTCAPQHAPQYARRVSEGGRDDDRGDTRIISTTTTIMACARHARLSVRVSVMRARKSVTAPVRVLRELSRGGHTDTGHRGRVTWIKRNISPFKKRS